ncbi:MAG: hypothetical protein GWN00_28800 [Aliifodinibius sp.]|nr:hypothetical protein [Fodinibius sp.]NIY28656.1 hypothetical protein [Fodinibius sp.]
MTNANNCPRDFKGTSAQRTEVVYVCSPEWQHYLFTSLRSLLASGTTFDQIVIYCVGKRPRSWNFLDSRILVEEVTPLAEGYFLINKAYACQRPDKVDRVVFLDADTMVLKPLDTLYKNVSEDFIARVAGQFQNKEWNQKKWTEALRIVNGDDTAPYFNSGVIIFQNGTHRRVGHSWLDFTRRNLDGGLMKLRSKRFAEQLSLSLAVGAAGLSYHMLDRTGHAYGWRNEPYRDAVVFHTSGPFLPMATVIERELGIANLDLPAFKGAGRMNRIKLHRKFRHIRARVKSLMKIWMPSVTHLLFVRN